MRESNILYKSIFLEYSILDMEFSYGMGIYILDVVIYENDGKTIDHCKYFGNGRRK